MHLHLKISLCRDDGTRFFGPGVCALLEGIQKTGSLRSAALDMGMAYSKAYRILKRAEEEFGFPLTCRKSGGPGGGGSELTPKAEALIAGYRSLTADFERISQELYQQWLSDF